MYIMYNNEQDDASNCSDESSGAEIFKSIPKASSAFCIWKIEVRAAFVSPSLL